MKTEISITRNDKHHKECMNKIKIKRQFGEGVVDNFIVSLSDEELNLLRKRIKCHLNV